MSVAEKPVTTPPRRYRYAYATIAHFGTKDAKGFVVTTCGRTIRPETASEATHRWPMCAMCAPRVRLPVAPFAAEVAE